jgi:hypothetical protein
MGVVLKRAKYFIYHPDIPASLRRLYPEMIRPLLLPRPKSGQLDLFDSNPIALPSPTPVMPAIAPAPAMPTIAPTPAISFPQPAALSA